MADPSSVTETIYPALAAPLQGGLAPSPYNFEFTGDDGLRLTVNNSQSGVRVAVNYRVHRRENTSHASSFGFTPTADRAANTFEFAIGEGYLLNVSVFASSGTPKRGQCFIRLQVIRGNGASAIVLGTIAQGYVTAGRDLAWPGSPLENSTAGDGYLRSIIGTDPAAGMMMSETVPTGARWDVLALAIRLATDATAVTRRVEILYTDGINRYMRVANPATMGASDSQLFFWGQGLPLTTLVEPGANQAGLISNLSLIGGHEVGTLVDYMQAGDNLAAPLLLVREWLEV